MDLTGHTTTCGVAGDFKNKPPKPQIPGRIQSRFEASHGPGGRNSKLQRNDAVGTALQCKPITKSLGDF